MTAGKKAIVIGGGPAGLMAAEQLSQAGIPVDLYDAMPSVGRKFLMAGRGGLNLTHAEPFARFVTRYREATAVITPHLERFGADALRAWAAALGVETFVGSSRRVFPTEMKAAPLLRAWLRRLRANGVTFHMRHRWRGWDGDGVVFDTPEGPKTVTANAVVLALGGGSWAKLGSDGAWVDAFKAAGLPVVQLQPANCGFDADWSPFMIARFAGAPVKPVVASFGGEKRQGEFIVTDTGVEGGLIYAISAPLRDAIVRDGTATLLLDLAPRETVADLARARGKASLSTHLRKRASIDGVRAALLRELCTPDDLADDRRLAERIKALPLVLKSPSPIDEAISTAGGVPFPALTSDLMLTQRPGVFCAGEMLDWEAPTGGYLLTACFATGRSAGEAAAKWLSK